MLPGILRLFFFSCCLAMALAYLNEQSAFEDVSVLSFSIDLCMAHGMAPEPGFPSAPALTAQDEFYFFVHVAPSPSSSIRGRSSIHPHSIQSY